MKRFTKICLILCGIFLVLGIVFVIAGFAMGASPWQYLRMEGLFVDDRPKSGENPESYDFDHSFQEEILELEISINHGEVYLSTQEEDRVRVVANHGGKDLQCKLEGKELQIVDRRGNNQQELELTVFLPAKTLTDLDLELAAGMLKAECLRAKDVSVEVRAGECVIDELIAGKSAELHTGAGSIRIAHYEGPNLDVECEAGEIEVCLDGGFTDYNYEADVAMGELVLGDNTYSGIGNEQHIRNNAASNVELDCAMGSVRISFTEH